MMATPRLPHLPTEVWGDIIFEATRPPFGCYPLTSLKHSPFSLSPSENLSGHLSTLYTRTQLVLVSRQWNALGTSRLYETLVLSHSDNYHGLWEALLREERDEGEGFGRFVRCVVVPYEPNPSISPVAIISRLPNLEVIVRSPRPEFIWPYEVSAPDTAPSHIPPLRPHLEPIYTILKNVTRIDCYEHRTATVRSSGLHSLDQVLLNCPKLQFLSITGDLVEGSASLAPKVCLPNLTTLCLERFTSTDRVCLWVMENLDHVIIHQNLYHTRMLKLWKRFGDTLQVVEITATQSAHPNPRGSEISDILEFCPALRDLAYNIEYSNPPVFRKQAHLSLVNLRMRAGHILGKPSRTQVLLIGEHLDAYTKVTTPCLEAVFLPGYWERRLAPERMRRILQKFEKMCPGKVEFAMK